VLVTTGAKFRENNVWGRLSKKLTLSKQMQKSTQIMHIDNDKKAKTAADSSFALGVELHFSHQPCFFIDRTNKHSQMWHQIGYGKRVSKAFRTKQTTTQRYCKTQNNTFGTKIPAYCRLRRVLRANRASDFAFSTARNRSKPTPSLYTADARRTTPSSLKSSSER
jgi:hypothetical protein